MKILKKFWNSWKKSNREDGTSKIRYIKIGSNFIPRPGKSFEA
jgi:hypothetical protein